MPEPKTKTDEFRESLAPGLDPVAQGFLKKEEERRAAEEAPPAGEETPPAGEETPPTGEETPPTGEETPPAGEEESSTDEEAPPEGEEAPPEGEDEEDPLIEVVVRGKVEQVPFSEVVKGYSRQEDYSRKSAALADERKGLDAQRMQQEQASAQYLQQLDGIVRALGAQAQVAPNEQAELEQLRQTDPAEYSARMIDLNRRQQLYAQAAQQQEAVRRQQMAQVIPRERQALALADEAFAKDFDATYTEVGRWALSPDGGSLQPDEWNGIFDHRHVMIIHKAMKYDELTRKKAPQVARKLARKAPKVLRPGVNQELRDTQTEELDRAMATQKEKGDMQSTADAFLAREKLRKSRVPGRSPR